MIQPLTQLTREDVNRLVTGYTSRAKYMVQRLESAEGVTFRLHLASLAEAFHKQYSALSDSDFQNYQGCAANEFSLGVYDENTLVGLALAEQQAWNNSLWVWEFHIAASHQRRGLGRALMEAVIERARAAQVRIIVCETQNTNVPAIDFYRALGFTLDGIDVSYYSNDDLSDAGEVAIFMKRRLP